MITPRAHRRSPAACSFGGANASTEGFHDDDGNFFRRGDIVWCLVTEQADPELAALLPKKDGKKRDGRQSYEPAMIIEIFQASDEANSSRINVNVDLQFFFNDEVRRRPPRAHTTGGRCGGASSHA